ncbi:MAG: hypothetical protein K2K65_00550, partial [Duncaniella sp.]|nr:hypothetical protein [Duncaniella sp.]
FIKYQTMIKKFLTLLFPLLTLMVCGTACENDVEDVAEAYYWCDHEKIPMEIMKDKAFISFYPENEEKLKAELLNLGLTLTDVKDGEDYSQYHDLSEEASKILSNYKTATVLGDYRKAKSVLSYTIGWSPYYRVWEAGFEGPYSREFAATISFSAKIANGEERKVKEFAKQNNVIYVGPAFTDFLEGWHTFIVTNQAKCNTVEMANLFQESGVCEYTSIDFIGELGVLAGI